MLWREQVKYTNNIIFRMKIVNCFFVFQHKHYLFYDVAENCVNCQGQAIKIIVKNNSNTRTKFNVHVFTFENSAEENDLISKTVHCIVAIIDYLTDYMCHNHFGWQVYLRQWNWLLFFSQWRFRELFTMSGREN